MTVAVGGVNTLPEEWKRDETIKLIISTIKYKVCCLLLF